VFIGQGCPHNRWFFAQSGVSPHLVPYLFVYGDPAGPPSAHAGPLMNGCLKMPHRRWRIGRGGVEATSTDRLTADRSINRLTADRLAGFLSYLGTASPDTSTLPQSRDAPRQTPAEEQPRRPDPPDTKLGPLVPDASPVPAPAVVAPAVHAPAVVAPATPAVSVPLASNSGRHRLPTSPKLTILGIALTSRRLALVGVLTLFAVASAVILALS